MITVMEIARDLKMVDTSAQWFYVISDTNFENNNISIVTNLITEGNNVAFISNFTRTNDECVSGLKCHANELLKSFVLGLSKAIREEVAFYQQISDEEWEIIRASKRKRRGDIIESMIEDLRKTSKCSNCTSWRVSCGALVEIFLLCYTVWIHSIHTGQLRRHLGLSISAFNLLRLWTQRISCSTKSARQRSWCFQVEGYWLLEM